MLDKTFNFKDIEPRIYAQWEESGAFRAGRRPDAEPFCIVIPPPNVTGRLHVGHALNNTLQDVLARFERMRGKDVLWQPGMDHAGIATQLVVERQLAERQQSRVQMGREKFLEEVWRWKEESGGAIGQQLRRLGASADWSRERFTMDEGLSRAVLKVFVELYREGLIYKDKRLVNWDPRLQTAVSDLEVENIEMKGHLWYIRYPVENAPGQFITVATTRPETMLGDTAVAVHPSDERYRDLIGRRAILPLANRPIPIIADEYTDPEKGTGAVKITPGHDFNDFEVGKRHNLPVFILMDAEGRLRDDKTSYDLNLDVFAGRGVARSNVVPAKYRGLDRFEARKRIVADLEALDLVEKIDPITHAVPHDEKTKTVVLEPYLTEQWYLHVAPLAEKAVKAVEDGRTHIVPEQWENVYFNWLRNIHPWCISRQLWWGHQIPVWYGLPITTTRGQLVEQGALDHIRIHELKGDDIDKLSCISDGSEIDRQYGEREGAIAFCDYDSEAARIQASRYVKQKLQHLGFRGDELTVVLESEGSDPISLLKEGKYLIERDPDVLDTWFSSALWPFSTLGWPDETPELARYYPTSVLVTAFDIIFFWVARMMMMGLHFMHEVPFRVAYIHNRVLDEKGAKMSKTKGNVVDPLELIDAYGADALRFTLALAAGQGRDMRIGPSRVEVNRNFATKLWNAARFCEMNGCETRASFDPAQVAQTVNKWIVAETARAAAEVTRNLEAFRFNEAAGAIYRFVWDVFCDWYLEFIKPLLNGTDEGAKAEARMTAAWTRDQIFALLHPFMPFITEELWDRTASQRDALLIEAKWPQLAHLPQDEAAASEMRWVIDLVSGIRSVRAEMNVPASAKVALVLKDANTESTARLERHRDQIMTLARLASAHTADAIPQGSAQFVLREATAAIPLGDVIDFARERARLEKELVKAQSEIGKIDAKLGNADFMARAPEEVVDEQKERRAEAAALAERLAQALSMLG
ncbi:MAG TPA: valine--tRNA ligase [Rhizomicrobium sp.]|jgi:valyl-tRNA synthetase|nr:valine--tRNA ligase [Rhizomicrobium sp.]